MRALSLPFLYKCCYFNWDSTSCRKSCTFLKYTFFSAEEQQTSEWKSHCFHFYIWTHTLAYCALRKAMKDGVLWLRRSQGFFWTSVVKLLVILKVWSRALHLISKVISIFLWSPRNQPLSVVFWRWFKGPLVKPTSTPRAGCGETCTLWQQHRHSKIKFPQQILYKLLQDSTVWTKHLTLPQGFCWWGFELSWPLCLYWEVNSRPSPGSMVSLSKTGGGK